MGSWSEFLTAFWAGPGWFPGTGRLGDITFVEEHPKRDKYETSVPVFLHLYTILHFALQFLVTNFIGFASKTKVRVLLITTDMNDKVTLSLAVVAVQLAGVVDPLQPLGSHQHWTALRPLSSLLAQRGCQVSADSPSLQ